MDVHVIYMELHVIYMGVDAICMGVDTTSIGLGVFAMGVDIFSIELGIFSTDVDLFSIGLGVFSMDVDLFSIGLGVSSTSVDAFSIGLDVFSMGVDAFSIEAHVSDMVGAFPQAKPPYPAITCFISSRRADEAVNVGWIGQGHEKQKQGGQLIWPFLVIVLPIDQLRGQKMLDKLQDFIFDVVASEFVKRFRQHRAEKLYLKSLIERYKEHGFSPQLGQSTSSTSYSASFLRKSSKVSEDAYLTTKDANKREVFHDKETLRAVLEKHERLAILGEPGAGKSTMLNYVCYQQCLATRRKKWKGHIPVLVRVRDWTEQHESLIEYLEGRFLTNLGIGKDAVEQKFIQDLWGAGKCLLLIDGLDEAGPQRQFVEGQIAELCQKWKKGNRIVVSSRLLGFRHNFSGFSNYEIERLEHEQILAIAACELGNEAKAKVFWESINASSDLFSFIGNPFLLSLVAQQYRANEAGLPETTIEMIEVASDRFFNIENVDTLDRERYRLAGERFLTTIAAWHFREERPFQFPWNELDQEIHEISKTFPKDEEAVRSFLRSMVTNRGVLWEASKGVFEFQHRSLHEYYCGRFAASQRNPFQFLEQLLYHEDFLEIVKFTLAILGHDKRLKDKGKVNAFIESVLNSKPKFAEYLFQPEIFAGICIGEAGISVERKYVDQVLERIEGIIFDLRDCTMLDEIRGFLHLWAGKGWLDGFFDKVIQCCKKDPDPVSRLVLVETIGAIGPKEPKAMAFLREMYFEDPIVFVRNKAIEILTEWRLAEYLPGDDLLKRLETEQSYINSIELEAALGVIFSHDESLFTKLTHLASKSNIEDKDIIYDVFQDRHFRTKQTIEFLMDQLKKETDEFVIDSILQGLYNHMDHLNPINFLSILMHWKKVKNPRGLILQIRILSSFVSRQFPNYQSFLQGIMARKPSYFIDSALYLRLNGFYHKRLIAAMIQNFSSIKPSGKGYALKYLGHAAFNSIEARGFLKDFATNNFDDALGIEAMTFAARSEPDKALRIEFLKCFLAPNIPVVNEVSTLLLLAQSEAIEPEQVQRLLQLYPDIPDVAKAAVLKTVRFFTPTDELETFIFKVLEDMPSHEIMYEAINAMWHTCKEESLFQLEEILLRILNDGKPEVYTNLEEWRLDHPSQVHLEINLPLHHSPSVARDALWDIFMAEQYASEEKD